MIVLLKLSTLALTSVTYWFDKDSEILKMLRNQQFICTKIKLLIIKTFSTINYIIKSISY